MEQSAIKRPRADGGDAMSDERRPGKGTDKQVLEQAAYWFERVHAEDATLADFLGQQAWVDASDAHAAAFRDLEDLVLKARRAIGSRRASPEQLAPPEESPPDTGDRDPKAVA
jgi:ferric-dicitrate binding protein FerR (iron transport regulator)